MTFYPCTILRITNEPKDVVTVYLDVPNEAKDKFQYAAGQYLTFSEMINGEEVRRAYSICTPPFNEDLATAIKLVPKGKFSTHAHQNWKVGTMVNVAPPQGNFMLKTDGQLRRTHYMFAAGSGITPVMAMINQVLEEEPMSQVHLLYGSRDEQSIIFASELSQLLERHQGQLTVTHTLSQPFTEKKGGLLGIFSKPKSSWAGAKGRISYDKIEAFLAENPDTTKNTAYYICGPGDMIDIVAAGLIALDVPEKSIHKEYFASPSKTESISMGKAATTGNHKLVVMLDGEKIELTVDGSKPILDELIAIKKNPPYSCTSGACSSCMAKVTEGQATMEICYALDDDEIAAGYILTCQAKPTTEVVELTYEV